MVEGPGCKLKGEKMCATVVGQKVKGVGGNVVTNIPNKGLNSTTPYHRLLGHHVVDVRTLGKELFLILDHSSCVRVHFLMAGYVRYNHLQSDPDEGARKEADKPRLELQMSKDIVSFYQCSTELRNLEDSMARWTRMISLDICWSMFDAVRAAETIMESNNAERIVADVIMDQSVLPGVGNIIKNESCFDAGINPLTKIKDLTREHIVRLVKMNRDFSMLFYNCRKYGKPLSKHYKIYRFSMCKQCGGRVTKCKPGEYERGTYFCAMCQDNSLASGPGKNSLLAWAKLGITKGVGGDVEWECDVCTLVNKQGSPKCVACGTAKPVGGIKRKSGDGPLCTSKRFKASQELTTSSRITQKKAGGHTFTFKSAITTTKSSPTGSFAPSEPFSTTLPARHGPTPPAPHGVKSELCKGHSLPCIKKTVSKEGPTKLRLFWTCSLPRVKSCNHFSWADLNHPKCKHGAITLLREVYKMNENNGKEFFVCPKPKKEQCDFFQWNSIDK